VTTFSLFLPLNYGLVGRHEHDRETRNGAHHFPMKTVSVVADVEEAGRRMNWIRSKTIPVIAAAVDRQLPH
jgi:hypothetical protein